VRASSILAAGLAAGGWAALLLSILGAAVGNTNAVASFLIAAIVFGVASVGLGTLAVRRDRSHVGVTLAFLSLAAAGVLLLACGWWYLIEYHR
jgi:hypothetical protein